MQPHKLNMATCIGMACYSLYLAEHRVSVASLSNKNMLHKSKHKQIWWNL